MGTLSKLLKKKVLEFRITHRFGEIGTPQSYRTLFGFDNSTDMEIAFEYGISDKIMTGVGRCKGAAFLEYWDSFLKYNFYTSDNEN